MPVARLLLAAAVLACAGTAPAGAATYTYGSSLASPADLTDSHPRDWAAWPTATTPASAGGYTATQAGEVAKVAFKGSVLAPSVPPGFVFHVVVLRPQPDGTLQLMVASADLASRFVGIDPQATTTVDLQQNVERMCVLPGDVVALATSGGYDPATYPEGVPVQMFSRVATSSYGVIKSADTFQVGESEASSVHDAAEALMQVTVGTGTDARPTCRVATSTPPPTDTGPTTAPPAAAVSIPAPAHAVAVRRGKVKVPLSCLGPGACTGTLTLSRAGKTYGTAAFTLAAGATGSVKVKLSKAARAGKGRVTIKAVAVTSAGKRFTRRFKIRR